MRFIRAQETEIREKTSSDVSLWMCSLELQRLKHAENVWSIWFHNPFGFICICDAFDCNRSELLHLLPHSWFIICNFLGIFAYCVIVHTFKDEIQLIKKTTKWTVAPDSIMNCSFIRCPIISILFLHNKNG